MLYIVALCLFLTAFSAASWWALRVRKIDMKSWVGASVLVLWLAGVGAKLLFDARTDVDSPAASTPSAESLQTAALAWPPTAAKNTDQSAANSSGTTVAASVESLIGPLQARLEKQPQDAKGWALLAQSYAFVGDEDGAQRAVARAVQLGVDEKSLRDRVAAAGRSGHSDWIGRTINN